MPKGDWASGAKSLRGLQAVEAELNKRILAMKRRTMTGLIRVNAMIRREIDTVPPKVPVDTGNLRASYFCVTSDGFIEDGNTPNFSDKNKDSLRLASEHSSMVRKYLAMNVANAKTGPSITMGFSAYYAPYTHEAVDIKFHRDGAAAKYFEEALKRNKNKIYAIIMKEAKL